MAGFLALAFFIAGILTLSDYGINWDSPGHFLRGQALIQTMLSEKSNDDQSRLISPILVKPFEYISRYYFAAIEYNDYYILPKLPDRILLKNRFEKLQSESGKRFSFYQYPAWDSQNFIYGHPPLIDILSALSNRFFYQALGILGDIESYQIVSLLISSIGIFIVTLFAYDVTGSYLAGFVAGISLAFFPIFFAESHINMKDSSQAVFFTGAIWAFWHWIKDGRLRRFGVFIMFVALALGVKWNIVFLPIILIPWLLTIRKTEEFKAWFNLGSLREARSLGRLGIIGGLGIIVFLVAIWPYAWTHPFEVFTNVITYYIDQGVGKTLIQPLGFILPGGFNIYPILLFFTQTPEIILILGGMGVIWGIRERRGNLKVVYLLLFWLLLPLIRLNFPGARTYGGLRQIMEFIPALAVLAGVGGGYLVRVISDKYSKGNKFLTPILLLVTCYLLLLPIINLHPNQNVYFNSLVGGLKGAKEKNLIDWTLTYGNIYKQGVKWLNEHVEKDANIAHLAGPDFAISPLWLRDDISISPNHFSSFDQKGEYILSLYNPLNPPVFVKRYPEKFLKPISQIAIDGVSLLLIYKNDERYNLLDQSSVKEMNKFIFQQKSDNFGDYWEINLDKKYQITRILVENVRDDCSGGFEINEVIFFDTLDPTQAFVLNEKKVTSQEGIIEYDFPAENARIIRIYPQNDRSCFANGKILSISYLEN